MILGCIQPSYIPWRGYFHIIQKSDFFVFHDDIQYTKQDWRNRNKIKLGTTPVWLTVPVKKFKHDSLIKDIQIDNSQPWAAKHWHLIKTAYGKSPCFSRYASILKEIYSTSWEYLSDLDICLTEELTGLLGVSHVQFIRSSDMEITGQKTERLIQMCAKLQITKYISGPAARDYIEPERFSEMSVELEYMTYNYPEYPQLHGGFEPFVSVLDLLFNMGEDAPKYIWG